LLNKGKSYLEDTLDISTPFFIPPWNTYDKNTLVAFGYCWRGHGYTRPHL
jgi:hypothetical protein